MAGALLTLSHTLGAQEPPPLAAAETLFRTGQTLLQEGRAAEACPRLEESFRLDPAGATAQALGRCYEQIGRPAAAWARYTIALSFARRRNRPDREREITAHLTRLQARLSWLAVEIPAGTAALPALRLTLDGTELGAGSWGIEMPLDPGEHALQVEATGRVGQHRTVQTREGQHERVVIEPLDEVHPEPAAPAPPPAPAPSALAPAPSAPAPSAPPPAPPLSPGFSGRQRLALGLGAGGLALAIVGGALVVQATTQATEAQALCFPTCAEGGGTARYEQSLTTRRWATATFAGSGALLVGGVALWWTAPRTQVAVAPTSGGAVALVRTSF